MTFALSLSLKASFTLIVSLECFDAKPPAIAMLAASEAMMIFFIFILLKLVVKFSKDITFLMLMKGKFYKKSLAPFDARSVSYISLASKFLMSATISSMPRSPFTT